MMKRIGCLMKTVYRSFVLLLICTISLTLFAPAAYSTELENDGSQEVSDSSDANSVNRSGAAVNVIDGIVRFYEWRRVYSYDDLPKDSKDYRALFVWGINNDYFWGGGRWWRQGENGWEFIAHSDGYQKAAIGNVKSFPQIALDADVFYTGHAMGTPYITYHSDNGNEDNDYAPQYSIGLAASMINGSSGSMENDRREYWLKDNDEEFGYGNSWSEDMSPWGIIVGKGGSSTENDADVGKVRVFHDWSMGDDCGWMTQGNRFYGDDHDEWSGYGQFIMYVGEQKEFAAITSDYVLGADQIAIIEKEAVLNPDVTITVNEGATLSIESWLRNNGHIVVNGGTLIVQSEGILCPFGDVRADGGTVTLNGGALIVMDGARAIGSKLVSSASSSIINRGITLFNFCDVGGVLTNYTGANLFAGYRYDLHPHLYNELLVNKEGTVLLKSMPPLCEDIQWAFYIRYGGMIDNHTGGNIVYGRDVGSVRSIEETLTGSGVYHGYYGEQAVEKENWWDDTILSWK